MRKAEAAGAQFKSTVTESSTIEALRAFSNNRSQNKKVWKSECTVDWECIYRITDCSEVE